MPSLLLLFMLLWWLLPAVTPLALFTLLDALWFAPLLLFVGAAEVVVPLLRWEHVQVELEVEDEGVEEEIRYGQAGR